jgi:hypothetical protein
MDRLYDRHMLVHRRLHARSCARFFQPRQVQLLHDAAVAVPQLAVARLDNGQWCRFSRSSAARHAAGGLLHGVDRCVQKAASAWRRSRSGKLAAQLQQNRQQSRASDKGRGFNGLQLAKNAECLLYHQPGTLSARKASRTSTPPTPRLATSGSLMRWPGTSSPFRMSASIVAHQLGQRGVADDQQSVGRGFGEPGQHGHQICICYIVYEKNAHFFDECLSRCCKFALKNQSLLFHGIFL